VVEAIFIGVPSCDGGIPAPAFVVAPMNEPVLQQDLASGEFVVGSGFDDVDGVLSHGGKVVLFQFRVFLKDRIVGQDVEGQIPIHVPEFDRGCPPNSMVMRSSGIVRSQCRRRDHESNGAYIVQNGHRNTHTALRMSAKWHNIV